MLATFISKEDGPKSYSKFFFISTENLLNNLSKWKKQHVVDNKKKNKGSGPPERGLREKKSIYLSTLSYSAHSLIWTGGRNGKENLRKIFSKIRVSL